jgi:hypothetical protein
MKIRTCDVLVSAIIAAIAPASRLSAVTDAEATTGRALMKQYADSIVSVELVATLSMTVNGHALPPRENKVEENGTVISPTGLTVTVLSAIDPREAIEAMVSARNMGGQKIELGETEFKDVKLRLANNTEVPGVIVLKDPDLNLVFIAPLPDATAKPRTFPYVSLDKSTTGEILGNYYFVNRAPKSLQRVPIIRLTNVIAIVEKPRRMYLLSESTVGVTVYDASGLVLGLIAPYLENGRPSGRAVVLAASDVADLATQAAAVKPEDVENTQESSGSDETPGAPAAPPPAGQPPAGQPPAQETPPKT